MSMYPYINEQFLPLCHLICEDRFDGTVRQSAQLIADYFAVRDVVVMPLDALGQNLVPIGHFRRGDATWVSSQPAVNLTEDRNRGGAFSHSVMARKSGFLNASKDTACVPLRRANGATLGVALISKFDGAQTDHLNSRHRRVLLDAIGALLGHAMDRRMQKAEQESLHSSLTYVDRERQKLRESMRSGLEDKLPGRSKAMNVMRNQILILANQSKLVMIFGNDGSGKERIANEIHRASRHARSPFVFVDCRDLNDETFAPSLFGYKRGAISGVASERKGYIRAAGAGTVYFDRIDVLSKAHQASIRRIMETGKYRTLGSERDVPIAARFMFSAPLEAANGAIPDGFDPALYLQLVKAPVVVPPLSTRTEDIPDIVQAALENNAKAQRVRLTLDADVIPWLMGQPLVGDICALEGLIELAYSRCLPEKRSLSPQDFAPLDAPQSAIDMPEEIQSFKAMVASFEAAVIQEALKRECGNREKAAHVLNIPKRTLADKCKKYQIS